MRLSPTRFNRFLNKIGQSVSWQRASDCPCRDSSSGAARYNCANCHGTGVLWADPATGVVALTGQKLQLAWAQFGLWEQGDVVVSLPSDSPVYAMGQFDRVRFLDSSRPFSSVLTHRDAGDTLGPGVTVIDRVFWLDQDEAIVEPALPALDTVTGNLDWSGTTAPADGQQFSVTGRRQPEYFCWGEYPQDRAHQHGDALPRRVVLRRFDLFGRSGAT